MCTLILGVGVAGARTLVAGAVRDERLARPSDPPLVLREEPRVVGGRDRVAGGTWLAVRERRGLVALLNRRPTAADLARAWPRSRGLLALEVAAAGDTPAAAGATLPPELAPPAGWPRAALAAAWSAVTRDAYAPFSLVIAAPEGAWLVSRASGQAPRARAVTPGWHVLTHAELDDADEPRAAWLRADLAGFAPADRAAAEAGLTTRLRAHADGHPAVCLHDGVMVTVSASLVWLAPGAAGYAHAEGRPCEHAFEDRSTLLAGATAP
jgi:hypothetical protein